MPLPSARQLVAAAVLLVAATGCDFNEFGPTQSAGGGGTVVDGFAFTDPVGDLQGVIMPGAPDVTRISGTVGADTITLRLTFAAPVAPWSAALANSLDGFVDLDLDERTDTGIPSAISEYGGDSDLGADYYLSLRDSASGRWVALMNATTDQYVMVPARFSGTTLTIAIPRAPLQDPDGTFRMSMVLGHPANEASDFAPNVGYYRVTP